MCVRQRATSELERCDDLRRASRANTIDAGEIVGLRSGQPTNAASTSQQLVGEPKRTSSPCTTANDERDEFVVAQRSRSISEQLLARTIVWQQVFHRTTAETERVYFQGCRLACVP